MSVVQDRKIALKKTSFLNLKSPKFSFCFIFLCNFVQITFNFIFAYFNYIGLGKRCTGCSPWVIFWCPVFFVHQRTFFFKKLGFFSHPCCCSLIHIHSSHFSFTTYLGALIYKSSDKFSSRICNWTNCYCQRFSCGQSFWSKITIATFVFFINKPTVLELMQISSNH